MWQLSIHQLSSFHQAELVRAEPPRLTLAARTGDLSPKAVRLAADRGSSIPGVEMPARDMNPDFTPEFVVLHEGPAEIDPLGVAHQPGGIVVLRSLHGADPDGERKRATVAAYGLARGSCHGDPNFSRLTGRGEEQGGKYHNRATVPVTPLHLLRECGYLVALMLRHQAALPGGRARAGQHFREADRQCV